MAGRSQRHLKDIYGYDSDMKRAPSAPTNITLTPATIANGAADGIENGQTFSIFHKGDVVTDRTDYPEGSFKAFFKRDDSKVQLPEEYIGHVMIFRTFDRVSYGLIMDGIRPVKLGDVLREPLR